MSYMGVLERRFREGKGERYLKNEPSRIRCQGCSKGKLKALRIVRQDSDLTCDDVWPEAQCPKAAEEGTYGCRFHGGRKLGTAVGMLDYVPVDFAEKMEVFQANKAELLNRTNEISQLQARNAELFQSLDDLVIGEEGWLAVKEARENLGSGKLIEAMALLDVALRDARTEKEAWNEMRANNQLIDKLTTTHFTILEKLRLVVTLDQQRRLMNGIFLLAKGLFEKYIGEPGLHTVAMREFAVGIRDLTNIKQDMLLDEPKRLPDG